MRIKAVDSFDIIRKSVTLISIEFKKYVFEISQYTTLSIVAKWPFNLAATDITDFFGALSYKIAELGTEVPALQIFTKTDFYHAEHFEFEVILNEYNLLGVNTGWVGRVRGNKWTQPN